MANFRFQSKKAFLTYPRCPLEPIRVVELLEQLHGPIAKYTCARESHEDGSLHIHILAEFESKLDLRSADRFDIEGFHPNVVKVKSLADARRIDKYCRKGGDFIYRGAFSTETWGDILASSNNAVEFLEKIKASYPKDYILQYDRLLSFIANHFRNTGREPYVSPYVATDFTIPSTLADWVREEFVKPDRPKTLVLTGPSRLGKTCWARSLGSHMYFNGYFNLDDWDSNTQYIIFDDIPWERIVNKKAFFGSQKEFVLTDKYRKKLTVKYGKPLIYICNDNPIHDLPDRDWYYENCIEVVILNKIY